MKLNFISLLNAAILTDLLVIILALVGYIQSKTLTIWYKKFGLGAVLADVLILVIGFIITFYVYKLLFKEYNILFFIILIVVLQLIHDVLFALLINNYKGESEFINVFKAYASEMKYKILVADACMMISTVLLESVFSTLSTNSNTIILICLVYCVPYLVFSI
jgi:hypothetical protein